MTRASLDQQRKVPAAKHLKWFGRTDRGKVRPNNEDAFLGLQFDAQEVHRLGKSAKASLKKTDFAFAVSDGMGGARPGSMPAGSRSKKSRHCCRAPSSSPRWD